MCARVAEDRRTAARRPTNRADRSERDGSWRRSPAPSAAAATTPAPIRCRGEEHSNEDRGGPGGSVHWYPARDGRRERGGPAVRAPGARRTGPAGCGSEDPLGEGGARVVRGRQGVRGADGDWKARRVPARWRPRLHVVSARLRRGAVAGGGAAGGRRSGGDSDLRDPCTRRDRGGARRRARCGALRGRAGEGRARERGPGALRAAERGAAAGTASDPVGAGRGRAGAPSD